MAGLFSHAMAEIPQTDVSKRSALPTANLGQRSTQHTVDESSAEYLDNIEEEWNEKLDAEIQTLADGMVDIVTLASVRILYQHRKQFIKQDIGKVELFVVFLRIALFSTYRFLCLGCD